MDELQTFPISSLPCRRIVFSDAFAALNRVALQQAKQTGRKNGEERLLPWLGEPLCPLPASRPLR